MVLGSSRVYSKLSLFHSWKHVLHLQPLAGQPALDTSLDATPESLFENGPRSDEAPFPAARIIETVIFT